MSSGKKMRTRWLRMVPFGLAAVALSLVPFWFIRREAHRVASFLKCTFPRRSGGFFLFRAVLLSSRR